jgi:hypothetical protein
MRTSPQHSRGCSGGARFDNDGKSYISDVRWSEYEFINK